MFNSRHLLLGIVLTASAASASAMAKPAYTFFNVPGSMFAVPIAINNHGIIAGYYKDQQSNFPGFIRAADGTFTTFSPHHAVEVQASGLNDKGSVVGSYSGSDLVHHAFIRKPGGRVIAIGAGSTDDGLAINGLGDVCGQYNQQHGFLRTADGTIVSFDPPGSEWTAPDSINDSGTIAGYSRDSMGVFHGFLRAANGTLTVLDVPNSSGTLPSGINAQGTIAGTYWDAAGARHGFVRDPSGTFASFDAGKKGEFASYVASAVINDKGAVAGTYAWDSSEATGGYLRKPGSKVRSFYAPGGTNLTVVNGLNDKGQMVGDGAPGAFLRTP